MREKRPKRDSKMMAKMALVDWVKTAIYDAMREWIKDHEDELSDLITEALSDRIEITFSPRLNVKEPEVSSEPNNENHG